MKTGMGMMALLQMVVMHGEHGWMVALDIEVVLFLHARIKRRLFGQGYELCPS